MNNDTGIELPKKKRNPDDGELDITPMIDVTFLLLAFFVVVSKMDPSASIELPIASYGQSVQEKSCVTLIVKVDETGDGFNVFLGRGTDDDAKLPDGDPEAQEEEIGQFVENELSAFPEKNAILIKAEGDVKTGAIELCKRGIANSQLAEARVIYVGVEERN